MDGTTEKSQDTRYHQIRTFLRRAIVTGTYKAGDRLPAEVVLCQKFGTSRPTVAKALSGLCDEGLIVRRAGSGSYVTQRNEERTLIFGLIIAGLGELETYEPFVRRLPDRSPNGSIPYSGAVHSLIILPKNGF